MDIVSQYEGVIMCKKGTRMVRSIGLSVRPSIHRIMCRHEGVIYLVGWGEGSESPRSSSR